MSTAGKWTASTNEERWDSSEEFDTRDEALEYAKFELGPDYGLDDGDSFFVGQIQPITGPDLAEHVADGSGVIDAIGERLYELLGDEIDPTFPVTSEQETDLDARLATAIREWFAAHQLEPKYFTIEHVEHFSFDQCEAAKVDESNPADRCVLHDGHEGEHEWP